MPSDPIANPRRPVSPSPRGPISRLRGRAASIAIVVALILVAVASAFLPQLAGDEVAVAPTLSATPGSALASPSEQPTATPASTDEARAIVRASSKPSPAPSAPVATARPTPAATPAPTVQPTVAPTPRPVAPAPVGVAGFGAGTAGGAGGTVLTVTNLNDSGAGSLRAALGAGGPRTIVFAVGGTIRLSSDLNISEPFVTIDGSTAPSPVTIRGGMTLITTHEVILRHLRFRPGDEVGAPADVDAVSINGLRGDVHNVVLDHVTMLWGPDVGGLTVLGGVRDVTVQYSIMGEGLYRSRHPEAGDEDGHSYAANVVQMDSGGAWPTRITLHHNLFTTSHSRMPRIQGAECVDLVNNVIYNWGQVAASGNPRSMNLVNNWFRTGPQTVTETAFRWQQSADLPNPFSSSVYHAGNAADGFTYAVEAPNGVLRSSAACGGLSVAAESAQAAFGTVTAAAGATLPVRDAVDQRVIANVLNRTGTFVNGAGFGGTTPYWPY